MHLFTFNKYNENFNVHITNHALEKRDGENFNRNWYYTNDKLHEILIQACGRLTEFRNKGTVCITFENKERKGINALLVELKDSNIVIITMLRKVKRNQNDVFRGCPHIYLRGYEFCIFTQEELYNQNQNTPKVTKGGIRIKKKSNHVTMY